MKHLVLLVCSLLFVISCSDKTETHEEYLLIEALFDPGDGSGQFVPIESDMKLSVFSNATYKTTQGTFCASTNSNKSEEGSIDYLNGLISANCGDSDIDLTFMNENDLWMVYLPCDEPCVLKFKKQ